MKPKTELEQLPKVTHIEDVLHMLRTTPLPPGARSHSTATASSRIQAMKAATSGRSAAWRVVTTS